MTNKKKYLVALPAFPKDKDEAEIVARSLRPHDCIGDIKEVNY